MKIGIIGTSGVGKKTLAYKLACRHKTTNPGLNVVMVLGVDRRCPFPINRNTTEMAQRWIFHMQMLEEIENSKNDVIVCARTVLDNLAYAEYAGFGAIIREYLIPAAIPWMRTYDGIYWLRPQIGIHADGVRDTDPAFQKKIDEILARWIDLFAIKTRENYETT